MSRELLYIYTYEIEIIFEFRVMTAKFAWLGGKAT